MKLRQYVCVLLATTATTLGVTVAAPHQAAADTAYGCGYPQVCFYDSPEDWQARRWDAAYKDITSTYQTLTPQAYGSYAIYNSRNDDGVLLHHTDGWTKCLAPGGVMTYGLAVVDKIRIMNSPTCSY